MRIRLVAAVRQGWGLRLACRPVRGPAGGDFARRIRSSGGLLVGKYEKSMTFDGGANCRQPDSHAVLVVVGDAMPVTCRCPGSYSQRCAAGCGGLSGGL